MLRPPEPKEYIESPALTMLLTVQPAVLAGIARNGTFRGRGLLARFLYALPDNNIGRRRIGAPPVPDDVATVYHDRVVALAQSMAGWTDPAVLTLTPEARFALLAIEREVEPKLVPEGSLGPIAEWASKLVGAMLRIAGLIHLAAGGDDAWRHPITAAELDAARQIGEYFTEHAAAAFGVLAEGADTDAAYIGEYLQRHQVEKFTIRSLTTDLPRGRFDSADTVTAAVAVLEDQHWVARIADPPRRGPGRPPSPAYRVNLAIFAVSAQPSPEPGSADTADSAATSPEPRETCADCARCKIYGADWACYVHEESAR